MMWKYIEPKHRKWLRDNLNTTFEEIDKIETRKDWENIIDKLAYAEIRARGTEDDLVIDQIIDILCAPYPGGSIGFLDPVAAANYDCTDD